MAATNPEILDNLAKQQSMTIYGTKSNLEVDSVRIDDNNNLQVALANTSSNALSVDIASPLSEFDKLKVVSETPTTQISFSYNEINPDIWETFSASGGTTTSSSSMGVLDISNTLGSYAVFRSKKRVHYKSGQEAGVKFACFFNNPVALTIQQAGIATGGNGFSIGYNGVDFSILRAYGGKSEVRTLTVTAASFASTNATITLNGTVFTVPLTNAGGNLAYTAYEIAKYDYSSAAFYADNHGDTVIFSGIGVGAKSGVYSFSHATATATIVQTEAGAAKTNDYTAQANFNKDTLDGNGVSGMTINPQAGNVYEITFQWLGFGNISFKVKNPATNRFVTFHQIQYANANITTSIDIPSMPVEYALASLGGTTAMQMKVSSSCGFIQGKKINSALRYATGNTKIVTASDVVVLGLKNSRIFRGFNNQIEVVPIILSISTEGTKTASVKFILNPTTISPTPSTTDYADWRDYNSSYSSVKYLNECDTYSGGTAILDISLAKTDSVLISLQDYDITLEPNDIILVTCSSTITECRASVTWIENH